MTALTIPAVSAHLVIALFSRQVIAAQTISIYRKNMKDFCAVKTKVLSESAGHVRSTFFR